MCEVSHGEQGMFRVPSGNMGRVKFRSGIKGFFIFPSGNK
jgi:hypothetical protein